MARWWLLIVALLISIAACEQQQAEEAGTTEETAAAVDPAAVEEHIRTSADRYEQAALAGDTETLASLYTADAILLPPGMPKAEGMDAVRSAYQQMYAGGNPTEASIDAETIVVAENGEMAYEVGSFRFAGPAPDGTTMTDTGKYVAIWKPTEGGEWKIAVDIWNGDEMPGTPSETTAGTTEPTAPAGQ